MIKMIMIVGKVNKSREKSSTTFKHILKVLR